MANTFYRKFDERIWPAPCEKMHDLAYSLIHGKDSTQETKLAASIISAYIMLIETSRDNRQIIISELRQGPNI